MEPESADGGDAASSSRPELSETVLSAFFSCLAAFVAVVVARGIGLEVAAGMALSLIAWLSWRARRNEPGVVIVASLGALALAVWVAAVARAFTRVAIIEMPHYHHGGDPWPRI